MSFVIAIDGPSGVGKTSTARAVARRLKLAYLDTGAMYRAIACAFMLADINREDREAIIALTESAKLEISTDPSNQWVHINGTDVSEMIRKPEISAVVSTVSTIPQCRANLVTRQRELINTHREGVIAEGRDITTVVAPEAELRILLTADPSARMARRQAELGESVSAEQIADQVLRRDRDDSTLVNFTTAADGVVTIDSTFLTLEQVVESICALALERKNG